MDKSIDVFCKVREETRDSNDPLRGLSDIENCFAERQASKGIIIDHNRKETDLNMTEEPNRCDPCSLFNADGNARDCVTFNHNQCEGVNRSILIHGQPTMELMGLSRKYMCHYVYPYTWDDDIANMEPYGDMQVYHQPNVTKSVANVVPKSINILVSDDDYASVPLRMLTLYLPYQDRTVIRRNESDMYVSVDCASDVLRPYNSREFAITNTAICKVLSSIHVEIPSIVFHYHPSLSAYLECL
jgi:hypothetical protein